MTALERTAYPRFTRAPVGKELREHFTPTSKEMAFVTQAARGSGPQLSLMILLKVFQRLRYFPAPQEIPGTIIEHIRSAMKLAEDVLPDITPRTLYKYHAAIRTHLKVNADSKQIRRTTIKAVYQAVQVMDNPADLINLALETLINENCELPAFSTLDTLVSRVRRIGNARFFRMVAQRLSPSDQARLNSLLEINQPSQASGFNKVKETPKSATLSHLDEWLTRLTWLLSFGTMDRLIEGIPYAKIALFAAEARAQHASDLWDYAPAKRYTLLVCLLHHATISTRDEVVQMFLKRMNKLRDRAKEELILLREREREITEHLIAVLSDVLHTTLHTEDDATMGGQIRVTLTNEGGAAALLAQCDQVSAHHGNAYQPLLAQFYTHHRGALFRVLKTLDLSSTTQDRILMDAVEFLLAHEQKRGEYITDTLDLSFASREWQRIIMIRRNNKDVLIRRHLETCVFSYVAAELKTGDLCVRGSEQFADYRDQLLTWEECEPLVAEYCQQLGFAQTAEGFVEQLREWLTAVASEVDRTRPANKLLVIAENGEPILKKVPHRLPPPGFSKLEAALRERMSEQHLLDIVCNVEYWTHWSRHLGPLSGSEPKMEDARVRHILTVFAYGTNLGPYQMARHLRGEITGQMLSMINRRHVTGQKLDMAIRDVVNYFNRCSLPHYWGSGKRAAADGTQYDLADENLLAERHIRYGGYGGIAYHHVSDLYIALFSHFIACGVWEAVYIIDGLLKNESDIQPDIIHADTQGQNLPVFGLSHLLGIQLMPRIRNWKDLKLYRPSRKTVYEHIDPLFGEDVVDWDLIQTHWQDLFRVILSIKAGKILPSTLLRKLSNYSRKNRLYQAFHALGCVVRTVFLLQYISDAKLREIITATTNKVEQFNAFSKWLFFGGEGKITDQTPEEQEKRIKYNDLVANAVILNNTVEMAGVLKGLMKEGGYMITKEAVSMLSPYQTHHIKRFGNYVIDLERLPPPFEADFSLEPGREKSSQ